MPKGSPELTEQKKNEIIDACEKVYKEQGFQGVNIKEISTVLNMTRPAIYHYFETKEEILLGLLVREYGKWLCELSDFDLNVKHSRDELIEVIAESLSKRDVMLRILNMNLFEIEINTRVKNLVEFKCLFMAKSKLFRQMLTVCMPEISEKEAEIINTNLDVFLIGLYPFTHHTDKQLEAMKMAGIELNEKSIYEMVKEFIERNI